MRYDSLGFDKPDPKQVKKLKKYLSQGEEVIFFSGISQRYYIIQTIVWFPIAILLIGLPKLLKILRKNHEIHYAVTNRRFIIIEGIFSKKITSAPIHQITHITLNQSFFDRFIYNSGSISIVTAGYDRHVIVMEKVPNPIKVKVLYEDLSSRYEKGLRNRKKQTLKNFTDEYEIRPKIKILKPR